MRDIAKTAGTQSTTRAARARGLLVMWVALASGCATVGRPPLDLDLDHAEIVADPAPPVLRVDGYSGKDTAAGVGALKGGGTGAFVGTVACMGTGLFFPICIAAVVPTATAIGTVGWATTAAVMSEGGTAVAAKRDLLQSNAPANAYAALLATHLHTAAHDQADFDLALAGGPTASIGGANGAPSTVARPWQIEVALTEVACDDNRPGQPFALRVQGRMRLHRAGQADTVYEKSLAAHSDAARTTQEWGEDGGSALKVSLDQNLRQLAQQMLDDLMHRPQVARGNSARPH